jgi:hypothetical protein
MNTQTTVTKTETLGVNNVKAEVAVVDGTTHTLTLQDSQQEGRIRLHNAADITALKQFLINAGY